MKNFLNLLFFFVAFSGQAYAADDEQADINPELPDVSQNYSPGVGEIMAGIQLRHAKLWYAGTGANWKLAKYELDEILEGLEDVKKYHPDFEGRPLAEMIGPITSGPVEKLTKAIQARQKVLFMKSFDGLSQACNACHTANGFDFIHIQRPVSQPFTNQRYKRP
ncbi:hypothetical protein [Candidatus Nitrotoga fabula]|uniref:Uncharacterized protein n=1 Tax=Candidatus Nitrotoga fabula TaxID=2182327 RepID=A0A916BDT6_9PROT|nr:hypothetical protein [Candidatus Nitrotoga fabula]CAE6709184.1 conserved exported hypothetical protein [Candidatus Nitrotoga fabula]